MPDGYTGDTEALREDDGPSADPDRDPTDDDRSAHPEAVERDAHAEAVEREFDWRGWTLVAAVVVSFLVVPGIIYLYPRVGTSFGLSFWDTYLALPMVPALVLALLAVWAATRPRGGGG